MLPEHQGHRIGPRLLDAAVELARNRGRPLVAEYIAANASAGRFYARHGFERESDPSDPLSSIWMRLQTRS